MWSEQARTCKRHREGRARDHFAGFSVGVSAAALGAVESAFGTSFARPRMAQEVAAQGMGVKSLALPGEPSGVEREIMGQLPSGFWVAMRKSIPRWICGCWAV